VINSQIERSRAFHVLSVDIITLRNQGFDNAQSIMLDGIMDRIITVLHKGTANKRSDNHRAKEGQRQ
jgi:hypothetical protein